MIHAVLRAGGIDAGLALGGIDVTLGSNAHDGASPWFVTEADESDGSFALLDPAMAVVTNIENDHLTSDDELPGLVRAFAEFLAKLPDDGVAVIGRDNPLAASLQSHDLRARIVTFGFDCDATVRAANVEFSGFGARFDAIAGDRLLGRFQLRVPGAMNVQNALAAIAVGHTLDVPVRAIDAALAAFRGVRRRFDVLMESQRITIVDDYAHHPTAVRETIATARRYHDGPMLVAFEPHRYTRTQYLATEFAEALSGADEVILTPIYPAAEPPIPGVNAHLIGEPLVGFGKTVDYIDNVHHIPAFLEERAPLGSMVLMLGAGSISEVAHRYARERAEAKVPAR
jgi:UDP-N-acetylmuramate--alanine ligase